MQTSSGISPSKVFLPQQEQGFALLLDFLIHQFPAIPEKEWLSRFEDGLISNVEGVPLDASVGYEGGTVIYYFKRVISEEIIPFQEQVLYEDAHLLIADKPHFLPVTPGGHYLEQTLLVRLKKATGLESLSPIHRIDRETAGLVAFSKRPEDRNAYQSLFRDKVVTKVYEAIAIYRDDLRQQFPIHHRSRIEESDVFMQMHEVVGEPNSDSLVELLAIKGEWARYRLQLGTGKKHQLRVHMSALGLPIKNDQIYPVLKPHVVINKDFTHPLQLLAKELSFTDPITQKKHHFFSQQALHL
jgi:tRNA pseudouridine32 synthase/23S rRNA pseudouridine746 synthase